MPVFGQKNRGIGFSDGVFYFGELISEVRYWADVYRNLISFIIIILS